MSVNPGGECSTKTETN